ncbi:hypothetical protein RF644_17620 [Kocuria sp. CPCC 205258]|uniref:hypothetical protein n=1 Tax=Kocuria sp. CPCC 205258 TaxID=3073552 RepID=UPI0034D56AD4
MKTTAPRLIALTALAGICLTGCSEADVHEAIMGAPVAAATQISPDSGCTIAENAGAPGKTDGDPTIAPQSLSITCGDKGPVILTGDFSHKTANDFDLEATGVKQVIVVDDQARIWHNLRGEDCLTIQHLDSLDAKRDTCEHNA